MNDFLRGPEHVQQRRIDLLRGARLHDAEKLLENERCGTNLQELPSDRFSCILDMTGRASWLVYCWLRKIYQRFASLAISRMPMDRRLIDCAGLKGGEVKNGCH